MPNSVATDRRHALRYRRLGRDRPSLYPTVSKTRSRPTVAIPDGIEDPVATGSLRDGWWSRALRRSGSPGAEGARSRSHAVTSTSGTTNRSQCSSPGDQTNMALSGGPPSKRTIASPVASTFEARTGRRQMPMARNPDAGRREREERWFRSKRSKRASRRARKSARSARARASFRVGQRRRSTRKHELIALELVSREVRWMLAKVAGNPARGRSPLRGSNPGDRY